MESKQPPFNVERKVQKTPQTIWIPLDLASEIMKIAAELGLAPNVVIVEMLKAYLNQGNPMTTRTIEKKVEVPIDRFVCPFCFEDFTGKIEDLKSHLVEKHYDEILKIREAKET